MRKLAWIVVLSMVAGCDAPRTEPVKQGLTIVTADTQVGLSGYFVSGNDTVFFESLRKRAPSEGVDERLEVAVRLMDAEGRTLAALSEGHMPPTWFGPGTAKRGTARVAEKAIKALQSAELDADFGLEQHIFGNLTASLAEISKGDQTTADEIGYSKIWRHVAKLYKKCIIDMGWFGCWGDHSASKIFRQYSTDGGSHWTNKAVWNMCNHGGCPGDSHMDKYKTCKGPKVSAESNLVTANKMCSTSYSWISAFGTHNCNDDTDYQVILVMGNKALSRTSGGCDNNSVNEYASGCRSHW